MIWPGVGSRVLVLLYFIPHGRNGWVQRGVCLIFVYSRLMNEKESGVGMVQLKHSQFISYEFHRAKFLLTWNRRQTPLDIHTMVVYSHQKQILLQW